MRTFRDRLAKNLMERLFAQMGGRVGGTPFGELIVPYIGNSSVWVRDLVGAGGAAVLQVPQGFVNFFTKYTGGNAALIQEHLNEGVDSAVHAFLANVGTRQQQNANYQATEQDYDEAVVAALEQLQGTNHLVTFNPGGQRVVIDALQGVFHDINCPVCWRSSAQKKGGGERVSYREGCREVDVAWAVRNGHHPTVARCCGVSAAEAKEKFLAMPTTLLAALAGTGIDTPSRYRRLWEVATPKEQEAIAAAGRLQEYTPQTLQVMIQNARTPEEFLRQLPSPPKKQKLSGLLEKLEETVMGPDEDDPELIAARERSNKVVTELNHRRASAQRRTYALQSVLRRR